MEHPVRRCMIKFWRDVIQGRGGIKSMATPALVLEKPEPAYTSYAAFVTLHTTVCILCPGIPYILILLLSNTFELTLKDNLKCIGYGYSCWFSLNFAPP